MACLMIWQRTKQVYTCSADSCKYKKTENIIKGTVKEK